MSGKQDAPPRGAQVSARPHVEATVDAPPAGGLEIASITPEPTDAERAVIVSAIEGLHSKIWPHLVAATSPAPSPRWRYAGRPWRRRQSYGGWK